MNKISISRSAALFGAGLAYLVLNQQKFSDETDEAIKMVAGVALFSVGLSLKQAPAQKGLLIGLGFCSALLSCGYTPPWADRLFVVACWSASLGTAMHSASLPRQPTLPNQVIWPVKP